MDTKQLVLLKLRHAYYCACEGESNSTPGRKRLAQGADLIKEVLQLLEDKEIV